MSGQKNPGHNSKRDFLKNPVEHIDITSLIVEKLYPQWKKCHLFLEKQQMLLIFITRCLKIKIVQFSYFSRIYFCSWMYEYL